MNRTSPVARALSSVAIVAVASLGAGCAPPVVSNFASVSTHTLQVAADKETDVVWVQQYKGGEFVLMRCYNAPEGPQCTRVKTP